MHVAVLGSYRPADKKSWGLLHADVFDTFCEQLGRRLGEAGHFLVLPTDQDRESADYRCLEGFRSAVNDDRKRWTVKERNVHKGRLPRGHTDAVTSAQAVITVAGGNGTYASGMTAIRHRTLLLPVRTFGGASEDLLRKLNLPANHALHSALFGSLSNEDDAAAAAQWIVEELNGHPRLMIVHGRSSDRRHVHELLLAAFPHLHEPKILDMAAGNAMQPISVQFTEVAETCTGAIVIATPDDIGTTLMDGQGEMLEAREIIDFQPRARENVWIELGWLWARLGTDCVMLLVKDEMKLPSDLQGSKEVRYKETPTEVKGKIVKFVERFQHGPTRR